MKLKKKVSNVVKPSIDTVCYVNEVRKALNRLYKTRREL